jgi:hypothetical protein
MTGKMYLPYLHFRRIGIPVNFSRFLVDGSKTCINQNSGIFRLVNILMRYA